MSLQEIDPDELVVRAAELVLDLSKRFTPADAAAILSVASGLVAGSQCEAPQDDAQDIYVAAFDLGFEAGRRAKTAVGQ